MRVRPPPPAPPIRIEALVGPFPSLSRPTKGEVASGFLSLSREEQSSDATVQGTPGLRNLPSGREQVSPNRPLVQAQAPLLRRVAGPRGHRARGRPGAGAGQRVLPVPGRS